MVVHKSWNPRTTDLAKDDLRSQVLGCTTERPCSSLDALGETKISHLVHGQKMDENHDERGEKRSSEKNRPTESLIWSRIETSVTLSFTEKLIIYVIRIVGREEKADGLELNTGQNYELEHNRR